MAIAGEANETEILGASLGGASEVVWTSSRGKIPRDAGLQFVVAPSKRGTPILAGEAAERSRTGLGLPWPPEARVNAGVPLLRVPVPILWRGLTQRRDGLSEWSASPIRARFADLLAAHVASAVPPSSPGAELVLTIPDAQ